MLRKAIYFAVFPVLTLAVSCLCWLTAGLGHNGSFALALQCLWARWTLALAGVRVRADLSALDPAKAYVFMANHQSHYDSLVLFATLGPRWNLRFVAKESLFKIPFFGPAMLRTGHIPILRENSRKAMKSIDDAVEAAHRGICVLIFPEGTRSEDCHSLGEFKIGGMIMALKCGLPVAPIIISGSRAILPRGTLAPRPGVITVDALPSFNPAERFTLKQRENFRVWLKELMSQAYQERKICPPA